MDASLNDLIEIRISTEIAAAAAATGAASPVLLQGALRRYLACDPATGEVYAVDETGAQLLARLTHTERHPTILARQVPGDRNSRQQGPTLDSPFVRVGLWL